MYQINLVTYRTAINVKNAPRKVVNREKGILGGSFESVKLARTTLLKKVFRMEECLIDKVKLNKNETYVIATLFGSNMIENVFTIIESN
jgi:hypothetical protein|nr:MAG TPA: hypothetical protein [Caudoviricetes sp.]